MTTVLTKSDGSSQTFQNSELLTILNGLEAANNTHTEASGVAYIRVAPNRLLLLDVTSTLGRRLLEIYNVSYESTNAFGLKWTASNVDYDTQGAVNAAGFGTTVITLASINAATLYNISGDGVYLAATNLVKSQGSFQNQPAELKALAAGNGCTLDTSTDAVTLNVTPVQINFPPPPYGHAPLSTSTFAESTIFTYSNQALVFCSPLFTSTTNLGSVTLDAVQRNNFEVTHVILNQSALDAETNVLINNALASYSTTSQVQAMIDASIQNALDNILFSGNFSVDRSVPLALSISGGNPAASPTNGHTNVQLYMPFWGDLKDQAGGLYLLTRLTSDGLWGTYEISQMQIASVNSGVRLTSGLQHKVFPNGPTPPTQPNQDYVGFQFATWTMEVQFMLHVADSHFGFHAEQKRDLAAHTGDTIVAMNVDNRSAQQYLYCTVDTRVAGFAASTPSPGEFPLQANTWYHLAIVDDGGHKFYFNGQQVWSTGYNLSHLDSVTFSSTSDVSIREFCVYDAAVYTQPFTIPDTQTRWNASMI